MLWTVLLLCKKHISNVFKMPSAGVARQTGLIFSFSFLKYPFLILGLMLNLIPETSLSTLLKKMFSPFGFILYTSSVTSVVVLLLVLQITTFLVSLICFVERTELWLLTFLLIPFFHACIKCRQEEHLQIVIINKCWKYFWFLLLSDAGKFLNIISSFFFFSN